MQRSLFAIIVAAFSVVVLSTSSAHSGSYPFGDEPYRLNWGYDPEIQSGCWTWNWQQYHWDDHCPLYVHSGSPMTFRPHVCQTFALV
jgi:hypothetical protein